MCECESSLLVKSALQMLCEVFPGREAVGPHSHCAAVVDGVAQFGQGHVQFVHPENKNKETLV